MHIVLDLEACQRTNPSQRDAALTWIIDFLAHASDHDVVCVMAAEHVESIETIRARLAPTLSGERLLVADFTNDAALATADNAGQDASILWLTEVRRTLRRAFMSGLRPDVVLSMEAAPLAATVAALDFTHVVVTGLILDGTDPAGSAGSRSYAGVSLLMTDSEESALSLRENSDAVMAVEVVSNHQPAAIIALLERLPPHPYPHPVAATTSGARPRLAYVTPLPPEKSGIADYSAELLPQLASYFDIDVIVDQELVTDAWISANLSVRQLDYFEAHASTYDHVLYHFGNSAMHRHMFDLLERHPGVVVLHDFYLANLLHYMHHSGYLPDAFQQAIYHSHGFGAVIDSEQLGEGAAVWKYPCNKAVLDHAVGVIVHSNYPKQLARLWYGDKAPNDWLTLPLLRGMPTGSIKTRDSARNELGIANNDFIVCSFGMLGPTKLNERLLDAWLNSPLVSDRNAHLVFVGELASGNYGRDIQARIATAKGRKRITITGFASQVQYHAYLAAADVAVQLRSESRGETSASVLDCMLFGLPTIVNAHGSTRELPPESLYMLEDRFETIALTDALMRLKTDSVESARLRTASQTYVANEHSPALVGAAYRDALLHFASHSPHARYRRLLLDIATIETQALPGDKVLGELAMSIAANQPSNGPRQLLVDISAMVQTDLKTGIQRVVRSVLTALLMTPPPGFRVEPVYSPGNMLPYRYARAYMQHSLTVPVHDLDDAPVDMRAGDIFLGLDLMMHGVHQNRTMLQSFRDRGAQVYFVIYDLLPLLHPHFFPFGSEDGFANWMNTISSVSDGLICISRSVADEAAGWLAAHPPGIQRPLQLGYFHLGADIGASVPSRGITDDADAVLDRLAARPSILMVGTVEPRKGHALALSAFELLWQQDVQVNLIIVGKHGWMVDEVARRLNNHPEQGKRLFWLQGVSDEMLLKLYRGSSGLLAASEGEGFGLPLIEAAQHGLPLIARDIPVFREVAGEHAYYFVGASPAELASRLTSWLSLLDSDNVPASGTMPWLTWRASADQLVDVLIGNKWYRSVDPH